MSAPLRLDRFLIRAEGPEALSFLDSLFTQSLSRLEQAPCVYAGLLTPQGKVMADMIVWATPDGVLIETDPATGPALLTKLSMYKLRANATLSDATQELCVVWRLENGEASALADPRMPDGGLGFRRIAPRGEAAALESGEDALRALMIEQGVPDLARDGGLQDAFGLEALFEELHGVDFKKGCFVGQENVSRMKRRATTRKKFCRIAFEGEAPSIGAPVRAGAAEIGNVRAIGQGRAMAFLRLDRAREAAEKNVPLEADGKAIRLDPPAWLIMPAADQEGA